MERLDAKIFEKGMNDLLKMFPNWNAKIEEAETMKFWYKFFKNVNDVDFEIMIESYIDSEKFNPTVAGLKKHKPSKLNSFEVHND